MKPAGQMSATPTPAIEKPRERYNRQKLDAALDRGIADIAAGRSMPVEQAFTHVRSKLGLKRKSKRR